MTDFFFVMFYFGGLGVAYRRNRNANRFWLAALIEAIAWPWNVGRHFAIMFYMPDQ